MLFPIVSFWQSSGLRIKTCDFLTVLSAPILSRQAAGRHATVLVACGGVLYSWRVLRRAVITFGVIGATVRSCNIRNVRASGFIPRVEGWNHPLSYPA